jgi:MOSC domain-containing protein YiiM
MTKGVVTAHLKVRLFKAGHMQIISVNVSLPREVTWKGETVETGIFKEPVSANLAVRRLNLDGDRQADLTVHGGPYKAVYGYPSEHYEYWRQELPEASLTWGNFGENLTTTGLLEETLYIGDRVKTGSALLQVTQPRLPCYKLALRFERDDIIKRFLFSRRSGFYFSVLEEGELSTSAPVEIVSRDPRQVSVTDIVNLFLGIDRNPDLVQRALQLEALPENWKAEFAAREQARAART